MTASNKAKTKNKLKIIKTHNLTKADIILETQIRNKTNYFQKILTFHIFLLTIFFRSSPLCKQRKTVLIVRW